MSPDDLVTISSHFSVPAANLERFSALCECFVDVVSQDDGCVRYSWGWDAERQEARFREDFLSGAAALQHFEAVGPLAEEIMQVAELVSMDILGPAFELAELRPVLASGYENFFVVESGFRR